jgi:hypothetical protein
VFGAFIVDKSTTRGQADHALISVLNHLEIPPENLVSVATDGAPSMMASHNHLIGLLCVSEQHRITIEKICRLPVCVQI